MRIAIVTLALPLLALAACKVTKDENNDTITAEFNQDVAENGLEDAANLAKDIGNDVENTAEKVQNRAENVDVDVDVDTNKAN